MKGLARGRRWDKGFLGLIFIATLGVILGQLWLLSHDTWPKAPQDQDNDTSPAMAAWQDATQPRLTLELVDYQILSQAKVIVDGRLAGSFNERYVTVSVRPGAEVYIDGSFYNTPFHVRLLNLSKGLTLGQSKVVQVCGYTYLGRVKTND